MSAVSDVVAALLARASALPELQGFTIADRPPGQSQLPALFVETLDTGDWSTASSSGEENTLTLQLATRNGSFAVLRAAIAALTDDLSGAPLALATSTCVLIDVQPARVWFDPGPAVERARLTIRLLIDLGDNDLGDNA